MFLKVGRSVNGKLRTKGGLKLYSEILERDRKPFYVLKKVDLE